MSPGDKQLVKALLSAAGAQISAAKGLAATPAVNPGGPPIMIPALTQICAALEQLAKAVDALADKA
jgi:hypothetical protein